MYGYIYKTTNLVNGKIYIGQHKAAKFDSTYKGSGKILWEAINKYGWDNFECCLIEECDSFDDLNKKEKSWIKYYNSQDNEIGYNLSDGGNTPAFSGPYHPMWGKHHSEDTKQKLREKQLKKYELKEARENISIKKKEFYLTEEGKETIKKIKKSLKNKPSKIKNKKLINNNIENIFVNKEELTTYLNAGWTIGSLPSEKRKNSIELIKQKNTGKKRTKETCLKISKAKKGKPHPNTINYTSELRKKMSDSHKGLKQSQESKLKKSKSIANLLWITNGLENRRVPKENLNSWLQEGWIKGRK